MVQQTVAQTPVVQQPAIQTSATPAQVVQMPTTSEPPAPTSIPSSQGNVRYIKLPPGITKGTYNLRPVALGNATVTNTPVTNTGTPASVGRNCTIPVPVIVLYLYCTLYQYFRASPPGCST